MRIKLPFTMSRERVAEIIGARCGAVLPGQSISHIVTDSRELYPGDLFFALKGKNTDGEKYVREVACSGGYPVTVQKGEGYFSVDSPLDALWRLSREMLCIQAPPIRIAITGSVGKSTTKNMISHLLSGSMRVHCTQGNLNNHIGVPATLASIPDGTDVLVTELGMNARAEISALSRLVCPNIGIITNVGTSHIGMLGSREEIAKAKCEISDGMDGGHVLTPNDEPLLNHLHNRITVGENSSADYRLSLSESGYSFYGNGTVITDLQPPFCEKHLLRCLEFGLAVCLILGLSRDEINKRVATLPATVFRHSISDTSNYTVINDAYNASIESFLAGLELLKRYESRSRLLVLGDILEAGDKTESIHTRLGELAKLAEPRGLVYVGDNATYFAKGFDRPFINLPSDTDTDKVVYSVKNAAIKGDVIYFKASHAIGLDKAAKMLIEGDKR